MVAELPLIVVLAGPNGAGKTTAATHLLQGALAVEEFVNADTIARGLSEFHPEEAALEAGRVMLARLDTLADNRQRFAFETTLSGRAFAPWLRRQRAAGYLVNLAFLSLPSPELAVSRVQNRVRSGGHYVPPDIVRRRYAGGLRNFFDVYRNVVDWWQLYDNGAVQVPRLIASGAEGSPAQIIDQRAWNALMENAR